MNHCQRGFDSQQVCLSKLESAGKLLETPHCWVLAFPASPAPKTFSFGFSRLLEGVLGPTSVLGSSFGKCHAEFCGNMSNKTSGGGLGWIPSIFSTSINPKWELFPFFPWETSTFVPSSFILVAKWPPLSFPPITLVPHKHLSKPSGEGKQENLQKGIPNIVVEMEKDSLCPPWSMGRCWTCPTRRSPLSYLHGVLALHEHPEPSLEEAPCSSKQKTSPGVS